MKGTITRCAKELVESQFGPEQWQAILEDAQVDEETRYRLAYPTTDIDDSMATDILRSTETPPVEMMTSGRCCGSVR